MNRKHPSTRVTAIVAATAFVLLLACNSQKVKIEDEAQVSPAPPLCRSVPAENLQQQFKKNGSEEAMISIYPVKKSGDMSRKDFDLVFVLHDGKNTAGLKPAQSFEKEAEYYVQYMKKQKVQAENLPTAYYAAIRKAESPQCLQVCLELDKMKAVYDYSCIDQNHTFKAIDSAGKCPPECISSPLLYQRAMEKVIIKTFQ